MTGFPLFQKQPFIKRNPIFLMDVYWYYFWLIISHRVGNRLLSIFTWEKHKEGNNLIRKSFLWWKTPNNMYLNESKNLGGVLVLEKTKRTFKRRLKMELKTFAWRILKVRKSTSVVLKSFFLFNITWYRKNSNIKTIMWEDSQKYD